MTDRVRAALAKIAGSREYDPADYEAAAKYKPREGIWTVDEYLADVALALEHVAGEADEEALAGPNYIDEICSPKSPALDPVTVEAITDAMVDVALNAWFASPPSETDRGLERSMRAALSRALLASPAPGKSEAVAWTNGAQLGFLTNPAYEQIPMAMWAKQSASSPIPLYAAPVSAKEAVHPVPSTDSTSTEAEQLREAMDLLHKARLDSIHARTDCTSLRNVIDWIETWISNPVGSYSVSALDGLFGMTRDKIANLSRVSQTHTTSGGE